jgi:hypothetical protein
MTPELVNVAHTAVFVGCFSLLSGTNNYSIPRKYQDLESGFQQQDCYERKQRHECFSYSYPVTEDAKQAKDERSQARNVLTPADKNLCRLQDIAQRSVGRV